MKVSVWQHNERVTAELLILALLIATALAFDFTNGFHDTGNAMATSIATGALRPRPRSCWRAS